MKIVNVAEKKALSNNTGLKSVEMGMHAGGLIHLMSVLTNLYSTASTAILREYVTNGLDIHIESGCKDTAVKVTLPTFETPNLIVQDFGSGMSREAIEQIYSQYGASTKRDSNEQSGGFGLGGKSALAISNRFDVVSINEGRRIEFYIEKNAAGAPVLYFVSDEATTEHSGFTVTIPFPSAHIPPIKGAEGAANVFIGVPDSALLINDAPKVISLHNPEQFTPLGSTVGAGAFAWISNEVFNHGYRETDLYAVIGGIRFKLDSDWILSSTAANKIRTINHAIYVNIPVGTVALTPNRENLNYSSELTTKALEVAFSEVENLLELHYQSILNKAKNEHEAIKAFYTISNTGFWKTEELTWKGQKVKTSFVAKSNVVTVSPSKATRYTKVKPTFSVLRAGNAFTYSGNFNLENKTVIVRQSSEDLNGIGTTLRRLSRTVNEMFDNKAELILVVAEEDYNNVWYKFAHDSKYVTSDDLINAAKAIQSEERKAARKLNASAPKKRPLGIICELNNGKDQKDRVRKVFKNDAGIEKLIKSDKVYYIDERDARGIFPYHNITIMGANDSEDLNRKLDYNGFRRIAQNIIGKNVPVFLISSRNQVSKFLEVFPNGKDLVSLVREYSKKRYAPAFEYTWNDLRLKVVTGEWNLNSKISNIFAFYNRLENEGRLDEIEAESFLEIKAWVKLHSGVPTETLTPKQEKAAQEQKEYFAWSGSIVTENPELKEFLESEAVRLKEFVKKYLLVGVISMGDCDPEHVDDVIKFINMKG